MARNARAVNRATAVGGLAILMWGSLATLTVFLAGMPPFQLLAMAFALAFLSGSAWLLLIGGPRRFAVLVQPPSFWLLAVTGLFAYHALYFLALRLAPAAEANLINYLWPLLIVLLSALAPGGERLRPRQIGGALMGLIGTALLIGGGDAGLGATTGDVWGYLAAFSCALVWAGYSVLNRRYRTVPSEAMIGVCGAVAVLGLGAHLVFEPAAVLPRGGQWLALAAMAVGPLGLAFLTWDHGTKHGDLPLLGTLAYGAPVLSTLLLVVLGLAPGTAALAAACALVVGGAWIASRDGGRGGGAGAPGE